MNWAVVQAVAVVAVLLAPGGHCAAITERDAAQLPTRGVGAYRGASSTHPENTLAAVREAVRLGAHMIEMDVRLTKDEQPVLMHSMSVESTTDGRGMVADLTLEEIKRLDAGSWRSDRFKGERVPSLHEALRILPTNIWVNVHLQPDAQRAGRVGARAAQAIVDEGRLHQAFLSCGKSDAEAALKVDARVMVSCDDPAFRDDYMRALVSEKSKPVIFVYGSLPALAAQLRDSGAAIVYVVTISSRWSRSDDFALSPDVEAAVKEADKLGVRPLKPRYPAARR